MNKDELIVESSIDGTTSVNINGTILEESAGGVIKLKGVNVKNAKRSLRAFIKQHPYLTGGNWL